MSVTEEALSRDDIFRRGVFWGAKMLILRLSSGQKRNIPVEMAALAFATESAAIFYGTRCQADVAKTLRVSRALLSFRVKEWRRILGVDGPLFKDRISEN
jgi:hypothetical protein